MSTSTTFPSNPLFAHAVTKKLTKANHALWKPQVRSAMHGARLEGHLTGAMEQPEKEIEDSNKKKIPNPAFEEWEARDQQILSFLLTSLSREVMTQVHYSSTAAEAWAAIEAMFASQTRARAMNLRIALATTKKGNMSVADYFANLFDDMAVAGRPLDDEEFVEYVLTGLDHKFESLVGLDIKPARLVSGSARYSSARYGSTRYSSLYKRARKLTRLGSLVARASSFLLASQSIKIFT